MSEAQFTPGPWSVDDYGAGQRIVVKGRKGFSGDYRIADAHFSSTLADCVRVGEMQANARLIAAAPDLFAALTRLESVTRILPSSMDEPDSPLDQARAALTKAVSP